MIDLSNFRFLKKLYGRLEEIEILLNAFYNVSVGNSQLMIVKGFSGIGKSVLVNEIHKPIVEKRGYFISGKFDQFKRDIPSFAIIQACRELVKTDFNRKRREYLFMEAELTTGTWNQCANHNRYYPRTRTNTRRATSNLRIKSF